MGEDRRLGQRRRRPCRDHEVGGCLQRLIPNPHCLRPSKKAPFIRGFFLEKINAQFNNQQLTFNHAIKMKK
jgi:hypothetical protein